MAERELQMTDHDYTAHPFANEFPLIEGKEFKDLCDSIAKNGILEPITLYQGMILDGRNRYRAAREVGLAFSAKNFRQFSGTPEEAEEWSLEVNGKRRHLTPKQKQEMVRNRIKKYPGKSNRQIAKVLGVSHTMVADIREAFLNPPEKKKFDAFRREWEGLDDHYREAFVREFLTDLRELMVVVEQGSAANTRVGAAA
jgi:ParB-like chromosome segregation protein Spo0J